MIFISLVKFKRRPTKADIADTDSRLGQQEKQGIKTIAIYWTFGRYDAIRIFEASDEKAALKSLTRGPEYVTTETLVAIKRDEAVKLLD